MKTSEEYRKMGDQDDGRNVENTRESNFGQKVRKIIGDDKLDKK